MIPTEKARQTSRVIEEGRERRRRAVEEEHEADHEDHEEQEVLPGAFLGLVEVGVDPGRAELGQLLQRRRVLAEAVDRLLDGVERGAPIGGVVDVHDEADRDVAVADQTLLPEEVGSRDEAAEGGQALGRRREAGLGLAIDRERRVDGDVGNAVEGALDLVDAGHDRRSQRVVGLGEEQRELAFAEDLLELPGRDEIRIGRDDQAVDGIVLLHLGREERGGRQQDRVDREDEPTLSEQRDEEARQGAVLLLPGHGLCVGAEPVRGSHYGREVAHGDVRSPRRVPAPASEVAKRAGPS